MTASTAWLFDLDGTLCDTLADIAASTNHVRGLAGLPPLPDDGVRAIVGDGLAMLLQRALGDRLGSFGAERAHTAYRVHHRSQCTATVRPFPGVATTLARLREQGCALAIVTNKPLEFTTAIVSHLGLDAWFGAIVGGDSLPQRKPDPAPVRLALQRLGGLSSGFMVGDSPQDLRAGRAAGLRTVAALYGYRPRDLLLAEAPDLCWSAFGEVCNAPGEAPHSRQ